MPSKLQSTTEVILVPKTVVMIETSSIKIVYPNLTVESMSLKLAINKTKFTSLQIDGPERSSLFAIFSYNYAPDLKSIY